MQLVASFLEQLYMERPEVPPRVLVPVEPADRDLLETWLATRRGAMVRVTMVLPQWPVAGLYVADLTGISTLIGPDFAKCSSRVTFSPCFGLPMRLSPA